MSLVIVQFRHVSTFARRRNFSFLLYFRMFRFWVFRFPVLPNRNEETFTVKLCR